MRWYGGSGVERAGGKRCPSKSGSMRAHPLRVVAPRQRKLAAVALAELKRHAAERREQRKRDAAVVVTVAPAKSVQWEKRLLLVGTLLPSQEARLAADSVLVLVEGRSTYAGPQDAFWREAGALAVAGGHERAFVDYVERVRGAA